MKPLALVLVLAGLSAPLYADESALVQLEAGKHDRLAGPIALELPAKWQTQPFFEMVRLDTGRAVPVQVSPGKPSRLIWLLEDRLKAGQSRRYRLTPTQRAGVARVFCEDDGKVLLLKAGDRPVLRYRHAVVLSPDGKMPFYARSGYIHPLYSPAGLEVTDDFAPDHPHQHGLFFAWTKSRFEGRDLNFWDQQMKTGTVEHVKVEETWSGPVFGAFAAQLRHLDLTAPGGPKPVLNERWDVTVYGYVGAFLIDLVSMQTCAGDSPLTIGPYHYGGLAIRGHRRWLEPGESDFLTSEGKTRKDGNHTRPNWVEIHGKITDKAAGVTILCHPDNFRSPQPVRLHPEKPYFCFAPMVLGEFAIEPKKLYVSRYRIYVHDGPPDPKTCDRLWRDYAEPPLARIAEK